MARKRYSNGQVLKSAARDGDNDPRTGLGSAVTLMVWRVGEPSDKTGRNRRPPIRWSGKPGGTADPATR